MHAMQSNQVNVLIVDDLGNRSTVKATIEMIERLGERQMLVVPFLIGADGLNGRKAISCHDTKVLMNFPG